MAGDTPNVRYLAVGILARTYMEDAYANIALRETIRKHNLSGADRALLQELVYGSVRWHRWLYWLVEKFYSGDITKCPHKVIYNWIIALYQVLYLERVPAYAAVNEAVKIAKRIGGQHWGRVTNGLLRNMERSRDHLPDPFDEEDERTALAIRWSHPRWLVTRWLARFGVEDTVRLCQANNSPGHVTIRRNPLKIDGESLLQELSGHKVENSSCEHSPDFLEVTDGGIETYRDLFDEGKFTFQDESAGLASRLLKPSPGDVVADMCGAPGGKASHLWELMEGKGDLVVVDSNARRLRLVEAAFRRLSHRRPHMIVADAAQLALRNVQKVLIDAPCTGTGVLAKKPDLRWKRRPEDLDVLRETQCNLLRNGGRMLSSGGVVVYSTCSLEPEENTEVVDTFLSEFRDFALDPADNHVPAVFVDERGFVKTFPHLHGMDGSFAARLVKN